MLDVHTVGSSRLAKINSGSEMRELLNPFDFSETVIVKPNFVDRIEGTYTSPEALRILFEALDSKLVVIEGHQLIRVICDDDKGICFNYNGEERDWSWIPRGGWSQFAKDDDWGWFVEGEHWGHLKELDRKYLDDKGFTDLFREFNVDYINVSDEIWYGNVVDPAVIRETVEAKYGPLFEEKLYGYMPEKLFKLKGASLISFNKFKHYPTFTLKNMFGLLPEPIRCWWHGPKNTRMNPSILAINKLYAPFFDIIGVQESLGITPVPDKEGKFGEAGLKYDLVSGSKLVAVGSDRVELDTLMAGVAGFNLEEAGYLETANNILGSYRPELIEQAGSFTV
jgi:uncharacterized protein (DUF362 family)